MSNPLWDYSLAAYGLDGVAPACLALQDTFGFDVNLLLYAAWLAHMEQCLNSEHLAGLEARIVNWRENVVKPLRALRRNWHEYPAAADLRKDIKALELRAEQQQQEVMYAYYQRAAGLIQKPRPLQENLALVARSAHPGTADLPPGIERLAILLSVRAGVAPERGG